MKPWQALVRDVPDFPRRGILFKDITPVLADADGFAAAPASSGGTGGMRPLSAEMSPSVQCASHSALLAEGSKASQSWPWLCRASLAEVTSAAGEPGRSRHSPCPANANWDQSSAAIARRTVRWNHFRWRRRAMTGA